MRLRLLGLVAFLGSASPADAAAFDPIGLLEGSNGISQALGVSDDGDTVVGTDSQTWAFVWTRAAGVRALPLPQELTGGTSEARAVSADGATIVGSASGYVESISAQRRLPVVWRRVGEGYEIVTPNAGIAAALDLDFPYNIELVDVADGGLVLVGNSYYAGGLAANSAFRWDAEDGFESFASLLAVAASGNGAILAAHRGYNYGDVLRFPAPADAIAFGLPHGISANGDAVVGWAFDEGDRIAFRWTAGAGLMLLGTLGADPDSEAFATTADGSTVVGISGNAPPNLGLAVRAGFIWDEADGMRSLQSVLEQQLGHPLVDWTEVSPRAISPDGTVIAGSARNSDGKTEPFIARLPETRADIPAIVAVLGLAVVSRSRGTRSARVRSSQSL